MNTNCDIEKLAEAIKATKPVQQGADPDLPLSALAGLAVQYHHAIVQWERTTNNIGYALVLQNPGFNLRHFLALCGVET